MPEKEMEIESGQISRRQFLKGAGIIVGGTAVGSAFLLSACGGGDATVTQTTTATQTVTTTAGGSTQTVTTTAGGSTQTVTTTAAGMTKYVCPFDNQEFDTLAALRAHLEAEHLEGAAAEGLVMLDINGETFGVISKPNWTLAYVLREKLGFTGAKVACEKGDCGVCTVIMNGRPVLSCLVLAVEANGASIETIEGLAKGGNMTPLQLAFIEHDGMQCGFCTPAQIMNGKAILDKVSNPTEDQVREHMAGTLCRCGAQPNIIKAILQAAG
jgi:aerobic-type carbon monoxide dehydrogenase small subunit (CoxS/CutS family)